MSSECQPPLSSLSWLFGVWESVEAEVSFPTMETLQYRDIVEFQPSLQPCPHIDYTSNTWHGEKKMHCEKGYLRIDPESKKIAFLLSHNLGFTEISEGSVDNESLNLESTTISQMSFTKIPAIVKLIRKLDLKDDELHSTVLMETVTQPLQLHLQGRYRKKK